MGNIHILTHILTALYANYQTENQEIFGRQGPESDTRETTGASRSLEELVRNSGNVGFPTHQLLPLNKTITDLVADPLLL